ncbi:YniB family protein, partial [Rosenbergiella nectarea]|uniref:YniB family protein n=1 Tax=Rosenbergiella nectarea TaxID=988801 RepID=UPI001F4F3E39
MTLSQARTRAIIKKSVGWGIFIIGALSTTIAMLNYLSSQREKIAGFNAVLSDFIRVLVDMLRFNTSFLDLFWHYSPVPNFADNLN